MNDIYERADRRSERRVQSMIDHAHFNDLYDLATDVFLTIPPEIVDAQEPSLEQQIVAACGVRGLAVALDLKRRHQVLNEHEDAEDNTFMIGTDSAVRYPQAFSAPVDLDIQQKIESLGAGLLDEAYLVLGTDVKPQIERYRTATSAEEQIAVLEWLDTRCVQMTEPNRDRVSPGDFAYHPSRLSPKLIGRYPHNNLTPTCLGFGIITASFLKQAGAPVLQGGVVNTHYDSLRKYYYFEASETYYEAKHQGFNSVANASFKAADWGLFGYTDTGFHAASYARLMDGSWYCLDPNYHLSYHLDDHDSELLQKAYDDLNDIGTISKGVEIPVRLGHSSASVTISECLDEVRPYKMDTSGFENLLTDDDIQSLPYRVFEEVAKQIQHLHDRTEDTASKTLLYVMTLTDSESVYADQHAYGYWEEFQAAFVKHVMHGMDIDSFVERCRSDRSFLLRRVEDIQLLPTLALQGLLARELDHFRDGFTESKNKHEFIEVGLPDYRVGCSALSDLAVYTQAPLSPQFFLSYWPSRIPVTETRGTQSRDKVGVLETNMLWLETTDFHYPQQYGIIKRHLSGKPVDSKE